MRAAPSPRTQTSAFGTTRREAHDASAFYARFDAPAVTSDTTVARGPGHDHLLEGLTQQPCINHDARNMKEVPDACVALVVTSPPYFVGKEYEQAVAAGDLEGGSPGGASGAQLPETYADYLAMLTDVFAECRRTLEPGGRIAVNVANLGRRPYRSLSADVIGIFAKLGLLLRGEIIWRKGRGASGSCAWGSFRSPANPTLRDASERIIIASKGRFDRAQGSRQREQLGVPHQATITADEFMEATLDIWEIPPESARRVGHPAPFPVALPQRLIELFTYRDDLVLDPFMGSGSTLIAARSTGRRGVGYDTNAQYVEAAQQRLTELGVSGPAARGEPSVTDDRTGGATATAVASELLIDAGFEVVRQNPRLRGGGVAFTLAATDRSGNPWWVEVVGGFTTTRSGFERAETAQSVAAKAALLAAREPGARLLVLTTTLPRSGSDAASMLRTLGPDVVFDVVGLTDTKAPALLRRYANGKSLSKRSYWN